MVHQKHLRYVMPLQVPYATGLTCPSGLVGTASCGLGLEYGSGLRPDIIGNAGGHIVVTKDGCYLLECVLRMSFLSML